MSYRNTHICSCWGSTKGFLTRYSHGLWLTSCILITMLFVALPAQAQDYLVGSQDVLKISVFESPDLATKVRVVV